MNQLVVNIRSVTSTEPCPLCQQAQNVPPGPQMVLAATGQTVCTSCGKLHDPGLAALLNLAEEAERIGKIGRHTVVPPYTALLNLAQAADNFVTKANAMASAD